MADACCLRSQCHLTDDFIIKSYDRAARIRHIGKSMSHLILTLSQILQAPDVDPCAQSLSETALQTFAYTARELGQLMFSMTPA